MRTSGANRTERTDPVGAGMGSLWRGRGRWGGPGSLDPRPAPVVGPHAITTNAGTRRWSPSLKNGAGTCARCAAAARVHSFRPDRAERPDHRAIGRVVFRRSSPPRGSATPRPLRRMRHRTRQPSHPVLLASLPLEVPWALLLGLGPLLHDVARPVHLPHLWTAQTGARARCRPHRRDRPRRGIPRILEPADGVPGLPSRQDP